MVENIYKSEKYKGFDYEKQNKKASKNLKQKLISIDFDKYEFYTGYENYLKNNKKRYEYIRDEYKLLEQMTEAITHRGPDDFGKN